MRRRLFELLALFVLGLAVRLALLTFRLDVLGITPLQNSPDAIQYDLLGKALLNGWDWSSGYFAARPPLMPLLVAGVYATFGPSHMAVALANVALGAAAAVAAYLAAAQLTAQARIARLAGLLVALDPASIAQSINLQAETLTNFMLALAVLWLARALQRQTLLDSLLAGLWVGLATLARPTTIYLFLLVLPLFGFLARRRLRLAPAFAALPLLVALGWSLRNWVYIGEYTYTTVSDFNFLFYRAVSVERWALGGKSDDLIRREFAAEVERRLGNPIDPAQVDSGFFWRNFSDRDGRRVKIMRGMAFDVFRAHPFWYVATMPVGLYHMYAYTDLYGDPFIPEMLYNVALYAAAAVGAAACWKRRQWATLLIPSLVIAYVTLATLASQTTGMDTRMRTSTAVSLAILAAVGIWAAIDGIRRRRQPA